MKKYMVYRAPGEADRDLGKHELVGVEYGEDIYAVTDALIRVVTTDIGENPEYAKGIDVCAYAPEPMQSFRRTKRYQYYMTGSVALPGTDKNTLVEYGVIEAEES
ncbi:carboxylate--amine ligase [Ruminococcaceae bacterium OttesenSCG-928-L11]|nr:carboxylate--amine ligase [Ruminococcaceae bacterium OttesenSCG-928-L11]